MKRNTYFFIFIGLIFFSSFNVFAKESIVDCTYSFNNGNNQYNLNYKLNQDNTLDLAFKDGSNVMGNSIKWNHGYDFENTFIKSATLNNKNYTCPTLVLEQTETEITIMAKQIPLSECNGTCINLNAIKSKTSDKNIKLKKISDSCTGPVIGMYNSKSHLYTYFRSYTDGTSEWSLDGKNYGSIDNTFMLKDGQNKTHQIKLNNYLKENIFINGKVSCPTAISRCVTNENNGYNYELSTNDTICKNAEFSNRDGQLMGSTSYQTALGENSNDNAPILSEESERIEITECNGKNSLLGDPNDEDSVAWILQKILNYIRIIGPLLVLLLSSVDFVKVIILADDEEMSKAQKRLIIRLVLAGLLFVLPPLVSVALEIFGLTSVNTCGLQ